MKNLQIIFVGILLSACQPIETTGIQNSVENTTTGSISDIKQLVDLQKSGLSGDNGAIQKLDEHYSLSNDIVNQMYWHSRGIESKIPSFIIDMASFEVDQAISTHDQELRNALIQSANRRLQSIKNIVKTDEEKKSVETIESLLIDNINLINRN